MQEINFEDWAKNLFTWMDSYKLQSDKNKELTIALEQAYMQGMAIQKRQGNVTNGR